MAPGNESTRVKLVTESRRPSQPRRRLDADICATVPSVPLDLDVNLSQHNLRTVRRGAAVGPSGMSGEHLKTVLESPSCLGLLSEVVAQFARAEIPEEVVKAIRLGRMTALQKPDGGVWGVVAGNVFRRLVARTLAQQNSKLGEAATHRSKMCSPRELGRSVSPISFRR